MSKETPGAAPEKSTLGAPASRIASSTSKNSSSLNPAMLATSTEGNCLMRWLYSRTFAL